MIIQEQNKNFIEDVMKNCSETHGLIIIRKVLIEAFNNKLVMTTTKKSSYREELKSNINEILSFLLVCTPHIKDKKYLIKVIDECICLGAHFKHYAELIELLFNIPISYNQIKCINNLFVRSIYQREIAQRVLVLLPLVEVIDNKELRHLAELLVNIGINYREELIKQPNGLLFNTYLELFKDIRCANVIIVFFKKLISNIPVDCKLFDKYLDNVVIISLQNACLSKEEYSLMCSGEYVEDIKMRRKPYFKLLEEFVYYFSFGRLESLMQVIFPLVNHVPNTTCLELFEGYIMIISKLFNYTKLPEEQIMTEVITFVMSLPNIEEYAQLQRAVISGIKRVNNANAELFRLILQFTVNCFPLLREEASESLLCLFSKKLWDIAGTELVKDLLSLYDNLLGEKYSKTSENLITAITVIVCEDTCIDNICNSINRILLPLLRPLVYCLKDPLIIQSLNDFDKVVFMPMISKNKEQCSPMFDKTIYSKFESVSIHDNRKKLKEKRMIECEIFKSIRYLSIVIKGSKRLDRYTDLNPFKIISKALEGISESFWTLILNVFKKYRENTDMLEALADVIKNCFKYFSYIFDSKPLIEEITIGYELTHAWAYLKCALPIFKYGNANYSDKLLECILNDSQEILINPHSNTELGIEIFKIIIECLGLEFIPHLDEKYLLNLINLSINLIEHHSYTALVCKFLYKILKLGNRETHIKSNGHLIIKEVMHTLEVTTDLPPLRYLRKLLLKLINSFNKEAVEWIKEPLTRVKSQYLTKEEKKMIIEKISEEDDTKLEKLVNTFIERIQHDLILTT